MRDIVVPELERPLEPDRHTDVLVVVCHLIPHFADGLPTIVEADLRALASG
ncbi:hypothetical protein LWC34_46095 [Kibdelosporangium philippinense]|uniref:Uncharacterized protein n=1 Tax=Kibdelosporangium philippinense TaxID=211113 RepID=A0ABS8ZR75_9PSEU|nr:hypothetical protein [Kibdelosporangium philippinense]MCE7010127.1 hypothetical protein [Kibdelosporangium philippinense]